MGLEGDFLGLLVIVCEGNGCYEAFVYKSYGKMLNKLK